MALAERWLAGQFNRPGHEIIDHHVYGIVSDGDLQEGVASEAASLAGTLRLGKLIYLYDDNGISIEGDTDISFVEDVGGRFRAYGWDVVGPIEGMDADSVERAVGLAQDEKNRPSLIICQTTIGYGSPNKAGTGQVHGEPLGDEEARLSKVVLGWSYPEPFTIPEEALDHFREALERGKGLQKEWQGRLEAYGAAYPQEAERLEEALKGDLREGWDRGLDELFSSDEPPISTREASGRVMNAISERVRSFIGGSADLAPSTKTILNERAHFGYRDYSGHNLHFGVREHAMGAIANGMALHGGPIPYTATFLIFSDYMRPSIRLGSLTGLRVAYVFTHDSIGLGQDGPTHQPVEHLLSLRAIPNLVVIRPADGTETVEAWKAALERRHGPTALVFSRQNLPVLDRGKLAPAAGVRRGGYVVWESSADPEVILIGTGSELHIALEAGMLLQENGTAARVVSLPSWELFDAQPAEYRDNVLPPEVRARVSIEAGTPLGWERYVGAQGVAIGVSGYGASAPAEVLYEKFGLTAQRVAEAARGLLVRQGA
jgi:transketolase